METKPVEGNKAAVEVVEDAEIGSDKAVAVNGLRLPYFKSIERGYGIDKAAYRVLIDAIFPAAKSADAVLMALAYCKQRNLDPFKRVVHIVPMWSKAAGGMIETIWPGIAELRTTAFRTGEYAGLDAPEWGPMVETTFSNKSKVKHPEWCRVTVHRLVQRSRVSFVGPMVVWTENYATFKHDSDVPNSMWADRPMGQLEKVAEAGALRRAFPEEIGGQYAAEEMEGRTADPGVGGVPVAEIEDKSDGPPAVADVDDAEVVETKPKPKAKPRGARTEATDTAKIDEKVQTATTEPELGLDDGPGTKDPEAFLKWADGLLAKVTPEAGGIEALETVFNTKLEPHRGTLLPPDMEELDALYAKHEKRLTP